MFIFSSFQTVSFILAPFTSFFMCLLWSVHRGCKVHANLHQHDFWDLIKAQCCHVRRPEHQSVLEFKQVSDSIWSIWQEKASNFINSKWSRHCLTHTGEDTSTLLTFFSSVWRQLKHPSLDTPWKLFHILIFALWLMERNEEILKHTATLNTVAGYCKLCRLKSPFRVNFTLVWRQGGR